MMKTLWARAVVALILVAQCAVAIRSSGFLFDNSLRMNNNISFDNSDNINNHHDDTNSSAEICAHFKTRAPADPQARCKYIQQYCRNDEDSPGVINYLEFYYCSMGDLNNTGHNYLQWIALFLMIFDLTFLFIFLGTAAADFFCPNLTRISDSLRLPADVAGVTFLALGNSAPDLFSSLVAIHYAGSVSMALGELIGAGLLVSGVVVALVTLFARKTSTVNDGAIAMDRDVFLRDIGFLILSVIVVGITCADGKLFWWEGLLMVVVYVVYVLLVLYMGYMQRKRAELEEKRRQLSSVAMPSPDSLMRNLDAAINNNNSDKQSETLAAEAAIISQAVENASKHKRCTSICDAVQLYEAAVEQEEQKLPVHCCQKHKTLYGRGKTQVNRIILSIRSNLFPIIDNWSNLKVLGKAVAIMNIVPTAVLGCTNPCIVQFKEAEDDCAGVDDDEYMIWDAQQETPDVSSPGSIKDKEYDDDEDSNGSEEALLLGNQSINYLESDVTHYRYMLYIQAFLAPVFISFVAEVATAPISPQTPQFTGWMLGLCIGAVLSLSTFILFRRISSRTILSHPMLSALGFLMGIVWIYFVAKEIVGLLKAFAKIFDLSDSLVGLTVFALGNSVGDTVSNVTMSRLGFPTMSIAASFAGPLMNILLTIGGTGILNWGSAEAMPFEIPYNLLIAYFGLLVMLVCSVVWIASSGYTITRRFSWFILALYTVIIIGSAVMDYFD